MTDPYASTTSYAYDAMGNQTGVTDPSGYTTSVTSNALNQPQTTIISSASLGAFVTTTNTYNSRNLLTGWNTTDGPNQLFLTTTLGYNSNGYLSEYDNTHQGTNHSASLTSTIIYQDNNLVKTVVQQGYSPLTTLYDGANRVTYSPQGVAQTIIYDGSGRRVNRYWQKSATDYYSGMRLISETVNCCWTLALNYDGEGNVINMSKSGSVLTYTWEAGTHRLLSVTRNDFQGDSYFVYDRLNRLTRICPTTSCTTYTAFSYVGDSDWIARETNEIGTELRHYLYANGKPLRVDFYNGGVSYFQYNWHGDAMLIQKDGGGGDGWTNLGVWGDLNYFNPGDSDYKWNAAWGYLQGPLKANFDKNDGLDMGLYYVHGRWYNQDQGLFLSPNEKGDYFYGGDGQDSVNFSWLASPQGPGDNGDYTCSVPAGCSFKDISPRTICVSGVCRLDKRLDKAVRFYSSVYGIPPDMFATTLVVEDIDDQRPLGIDQAKDWLLGKAAENPNNPLSQGIKGFFGLFNPTIGLGPNNVHIIPSMKAEIALSQEYPNSAMSSIYRPYPFTEDQLILYLLTTEGNMRYVAEQLRVLADTKTGRYTSHVYDLTDIDKAIIYGAYREGIEGYANYGLSPIYTFQTRQIPGPYGQTFLRYLQAYKSYY